jgi:tRNA threonylcarbamoyladenosine biosynthesis protein TsaB
MNSPLKLLAFDTSTDVLSIAVSDGTHILRFDGAGGAQASAQLIPVVMDLLAQAGWPLAQLDAIVFGRGPGSFTGLRTACAVAQGLAFGAGVPVLPVDTLLAVAEQARGDQQAAQAAQGADEDTNAPLRVLALLDARMDEVYSAAYEWQGAAQGWRTLQDLRVSKPEAVHLDPLLMADGAHWLCAGNAFVNYGARLPDAMPRAVAMPTAEALLRLAPGLLQAGMAVAAELAMPLYVRDKVAHTTAERLAIKAAQQASV